MCGNSDLKKIISKSYARSLKSVEKYKKIDILEFDF